MVETIQQFWKTEIQVERSATFIEGWNTTWQAVASEGGSFLAHDPSLLIIIKKIMNSDGHGC